MLGGISTSKHSNRKTHQLAILRMCGMRLIMLSAPCDHRIHIYKCDLIEKILLMLPLQPQICVEGMAVRCIVYARLSLSTTLALMMPLSQRLYLDTLFLAG